MRKSVVDNKRATDNFNMVVKWVVAVFFAILPIFYFGKDIINAGNTPARILFLFFFIIILFLCGQKIASAGRLRLPGKMTSPLIALLLVIFASAVFSPLRMQVLHTQIWSEDMLLSQWMAGIFMLFCLYQLLDTDELVHTSIIAVAVGGGLAAVVGLLDFFVFKSLSAMSAVRLTGTFFNPMFAGNYLLTCIPFAIGAAIITRKSWFYAITGLLTISVVLTNARAAWVALFIYAVYLVIYFAIKNRRLAVAAVSGLVVMVGLIFAIPQTRGRVIALTKGDNATRARVIYMQTAWKEFLARPVIGWGVDAAQQISPQFRPLSDSSESNGIYRRIMLDEDHSESLPHNIILLIMAELGAIGLIIISWLKLTTIGVVRKNGGLQDTVIFAAVGALTVWGVANLFSYDNAAITCLPWLAMTLIALRNKDIRLMPVPVQLPKIIYAVSFIILITIFVALNSNSKINRAIIESDKMKASMSDNMTWRFLTTGESVSLLQSIPMPDSAVHIRLVDLLNMQYEYSPDEPSRESIRGKLLTAIDDGLNVYYRDWQLLRNGVILNFRFGNPEKSLLYIKALKDYEPNSAQVRVLESEALRMKGDIGAAEKSIQEALRIAPSSPAPYVEAGRLYFGIFKGGDGRGRKLLQMSEDYFRRGAAIDISAFRPSAIVDFCVVLVVNKQYDDVVTYGKYLRGNDRYYSSLRSEITRVLAMTGDNEKREEIFRKLEE